MLETQTMKTMKMSKKDKEYYANVIFNSNYDNLTIEQQDNVVAQYNLEHCIITEEDERRMLIEEEYGKSRFPKRITESFR